MGIEKILHKNTILQYQEIQIDGFPIVQDDIHALDFEYDFFNLAITGTLKIKDSFDINNNGQINFNGDNLVTISLRDFSETNFKRTFRIIDIKQEPALERFKVNTYILQDEISWILQNAYISKSFTDTPVNAFKNYLTHLGIDDLVETNRMSYDIVDTSTEQSFVVPQNQSVLDFFNYILRKDNIRIFQDRNSFYVKEVIPSEIEITTVNEMQGEELTFTDNTINNEHIFKVHDYFQENNPIAILDGRQPAASIFRFENVKKITDETLNLADVLDDLSLNTQDISLQNTYGTFLKDQEDLTQGSQKANLLDTYIKNNFISIAVPGTLKYGRVGQIVRLNIKGNPLYADTSLEGDVYSSGKYFVTRVVDRIIADKLIQKIELNRVDATKPRSK